MQTDETQDAADQLGERADPHALSWRLPGTRRVWKVIVGSLVAFVGVLPAILDGVGWIAIVAALAVAAALLTYTWLWATGDLEITVDAHHLAWQRGRTKHRIPLQDVLDVRAVSLGENGLAKQGKEHVFDMRIVVRTPTGEQHIDGLTATELSGEAKSRKFGELLTFADYRRLCEQVRQAAARARGLGTDQDVPDAMRELARLARERT